MPEGQEHIEPTRGEKPAASAAAPSVPTLGMRGALREEVRPHERYAILGGFGLYILLVYTIFQEGFIHPIFPTAAIVFFLYPFSKGIVTRRIIQLSLLTFLLWMLFSLSGVLFPFIVAFTFSYLCAPLVSILARKGIPRWITSLAVALLIIGVYSLIGFLLVPAFVGQFDQLLEFSRRILGDADAMLRTDRMIDFLVAYGVSPEKAHEIVNSYVQPRIEDVGTSIVVWLTDFLRNMTGILAGIANLILIPFLSFYMTVDFHRFRRFVRTKILRNDPRYVYYLQNVDRIVNSYVRGILLTSSMVGALAVGSLSIFGVPYAIVLGVLTGLFNLIPTLGMFLNLGVAIVIFALVPGDFWYNTLVMGGTILALHALNANLVEPRVLGSRVGMHPVLVIASLFVFAYFVGFVGLLIAVPTTAVVLMFLREWYRETVGQTEQPQPDPG
jgi:predicted PurR-regulated permease PerM